MAQREIERWVTSNGRHIPIFKLTEEEKKLKAEGDKLRKKFKAQGTNFSPDSSYDVDFMDNPIPQLDLVTETAFFRLFNTDAQKALHNAKEQTLPANIPVFTIQPSLRLFSYNYNMEHESNEPIELVKFSEGYIVMDGNHRMLKASMDNRKTIKAKVYDMSKFLIKEKL